MTLTEPYNNQPLRLRFRGSDDGADRKDCIYAAGRMLRADEDTFLVNDPNISSSTQAAYRARNLVALLTSMRIKDGAGNIVAPKFNRL